MLMSNVEILTQTILPYSIHGVNPRVIMGESAWRKIVAEKQKEANHHCKSCGEYVAHVPGDYLECHEIYDIDSVKREFKLGGFVCLCKKCHQYIHQGRLRMLVAEGAITEKYYNEIITRGNKLLSDKGLKKNDFSPEEIKNPHWYLLYEGKRYSNHNTTTTTK
jgi:hypothetical protein